MGRGAYGLVQQVKHAPSGSMFAAKVLLQKHDEMSERARREFEREAAMLASLQHDNIVQFIGYSINEYQQLVLLTAFMAGGVASTNGCTRSSTSLRTTQFCVSPRRLLRAWHSYILIT